MTSEKIQIIRNQNYKNWLSFLTNPRGPLQGGGFYEDEIYNDDSNENIENEEDDRRPGKKGLLFIRLKPAVHLKKSFCFFEYEH